MNVDDDAKDLRPGESLEERDPDTDVRVLGTTEQGRAASAFLLALSRAARSFLLYDPGNEAIRTFLEAVRTTADAYTKAFGDLDLKVRPFELGLGPEIVYVDTDRERSLAFRLYRDGVRRVVVGADVTWHEVLKFLEVISVRYTGIRQTEDDMVVLLWKAGFTNIQVEAVEGVVEDEGAEPTIAASSTGHYVSTPDDFDLPAPELPVEGEVMWQALPSFMLEAITAEDASTLLPEHCVRLADELLTGAVSPRHPLALEEVVPIIRELRDFLLAEGTLDPLLAVVRRLMAAEFTSPEDRARRDELASSFLDPRSVGRLLRSMPRDRPEAPKEMIQLLEEVPGDHLPTLLATQSTERSEHVRAVAAQLIEHYVPHRYDWMVARLPTLDDELASILVRAMARAYPDRTVDIVSSVADRPSPDLQLEALGLLDGAPMGPASLRILSQYLSSTHEVVRIRTLALVSRRGLRALYGPILERVKREGLRLSEAEGTAAGEALVRADPAKAFDQFREWATPPRFFQFVPPGQKMLHWVAVSGLAFIPLDDAEKLIQGVAKQADNESNAALGRHCVAMMVKRRRLARGMA